MENRIDAHRLRQLREGKGWTQEQLAKKAGLAKQSIYRLEKGQQPGGRKTTIEGLCKAFDVDVGVLTGECPMPEPKNEPVSGDKHQLNVRVAAEVRNAFALTALRYRIPISNIIALAPLLFTLAAEQSLQRRRKLIDDFRALQTQFEERATELSRSWPNVYWGFHIEIGDEQTFLDNAIQAEDAAIEKKLLWVQTDFSKYNYDASRHSDESPFTEYLQELAEHFLPDAYVGQTGSGLQYAILEDEALRISSGDQRIANFILDGSILIHEIPKELLSKEKSEERLVWLNKCADQILADRQKHEETLDAEILQALLSASSSTHEETDGCSTEIKEEGNG